MSDENGRYRHLVPIMEYEITLPFETAALEREITPFTAQQTIRVETAEKSKHGFAKHTEYI